MGGWYIATKHAIPTEHSTEGIQSDCPYSQFLQITLFTVLCVNALLAVFCSLHSAQTEYSVNCFRSDGPYMPFWQFSVLCIQLRLSSLLNVFGVMALACPSGSFMFTAFSSD